MIRLLAIPLVALLALAAFAASADAKTPFFRAEISGGDLAAPVMIKDTISSGWLDSYDRDAPVSQPDHTYTLRFFDSDAQGTIGDAWATYTYYPAHDGDTAAIYINGYYMTVYASLASLIDAHLPGYQTLDVQPTPEDGGSTMAWWYIPSAAGLGLLVLGGGVIGSRALKRREVATS